MIRYFLKRIILLLVISISFPFNVYAEFKTVDFVIQEEKGDLQVLFTFDKEVVDIEFISPSGKVLVKTDIIYESDDLWASYRIVDAEVGQWKVRYDKKSNEYINYSIADNNQGLWAQYFNINYFDEDIINVSFRFDDENNNEEYNYAISAFDRIASTSIVVYESKATPNQDITTNISLYDISSGEYILIINAWKEIGSAEIFDNIETGKFVYNNPFEPVALSDFKINIYPDNHKVYVNWADAKKNDSAFKVTFYEDDILILTDEYDNSNTKTEFLYNGNTKKVKIDVQYKNDAIWSKSCSKVVVLDDNYLHIERADSNSKTLNLKYKAKNDAKINIHNEFNDEDTNLDVNGEGSYLIDLLSGKNSIFVTLSLDNNITYIVYDDYYYSNLTPTIRLFENINGKTFNLNKVSIIGEAKNADKLQINSNEVELKNGIFDNEVTLNSGENLFEIIASKNNGSASKMIVKLYKSGTTFNVISIDDFKSNIKNFMPLFVSIFASFVIIIISLFKIRKVNSQVRVKSQKNIVINVLSLITLFIIEGFLGFFYIRRLNFSNSLEFLDVIENSITNASGYLNDNNKILIAITFVSVFILINIMLIVLKIKKIHKKNN